MALSDHPMWRRPRHHMEADHQSDHVHWIELFYDLIHVVAIFVLGNYLSHHLDMNGLLVFVALFIAIWFAWADSSVFNSLYVSTDMMHRMIMAVQICTVMFMAAAIAVIESKGWMYFAMAYALNRAITAYLYQRAIKSNAETTTLAYEMARNFYVLAGIFTLSAFLPKPYNFYLFGAAILSIPLLYMLPVVGVLRFERFVPRLGHMAERFALLVLIVLGEGFFKLVVTLSEKGIYKVGMASLFNFAMGGIAIFVFCWIYFDFAGNGKPKNTRVANLVTWWLSHLFLMLFGVMVGVALAGEVKTGFFEPYPVYYGWLGCTGLAGFLFCLLLIQNCIEERVAHRFATAPLRFFGIGMALLTFLIVPYVPAIIGNATWMTGLVSQIVVPLYRARREFSVG